MDDLGRTRAAGDPSELPDVPVAIARHTLNVSAQPYVLMDFNGTITFAGESIEAVFGWAPGQLIGRNILEFVRDDQAEIAIQAIDELVADTTDAIGVPMVFALERPDGRPVWAEVGSQIDVDDPTWIILRLRDWDHEHHFDRFVAALLRTESLEVILHELGASIAASLKSEGAVIHHQFNGERFTRADGYGVPPACLLAPDSPWERAAQNGEPDHFEIEALPSNAAAAAGDAGFRTVWVQPILTASGRPHSLLSIWRQQVSRPYVGHRKVMERSSQYVQLALAHWVEHDRLLHVSGHDALTGVANRTTFRDQLRLALLEEREIAIAFCDLDRFKAVNDTYGHQAGDRVLVEVADRLRRSLRAGDQLARVGGDEFTAILHHVPDSGTAEELARRMSDAMSEPFLVGTDEVNLGLSVGVVLAPPGTDGDWLLSVADEALYEAKRAGGSRARVVDATPPDGIIDPPGRLREPPQPE